MLGVRISAHEFLEGTTQTHNSVRGSFHAVRSFPKNTKTSESVFSYAMAMPGNWLVPIKCLLQTSKFTINLTWNSSKKKKRKQMTQALVTACKMLKLKVLESQTRASPKPPSAITHSCQPLPPLLFKVSSTFPSFVFLLYWVNSYADATPSILTGAPILSRPPTAVLPA